MSATVIPLGELADVVSGGTPRRSEPRFFGGNVPWVKIGDMVKGTVTSTEESITEEGLKASAAKVLPAGTVLLSIFATIGRTAVLAIDAATNQAIAGLLLKEPSRVDASYLRRYLEYASAGLASQGRGVAQANINLSILRSLEIPVPPIEEQRRIATILDSAYALRASRRLALAKLDALPQGIFIDMFGERERFPLGKLGDHVPTTSGGTPSRSKREYFGGDVPWVKSGELAQGVVVETEERITEEAVAHSAAKRMPPGTVLLAMYGATVGVVATLGIEATTNQAVCCLSPTSEIVGTYLAGFLRSVKPELLRRAAGGAQPNISQSIIRDLDLPLAPLDLQRSYSERVSAAAAIRDKFLTSSSHLDTLCASLQQHAFRREP